MQAVLRSSSLLRAAHASTWERCRAPVTRRLQHRAASQATPESGSFRLFLYSKDDCPLCDGLHEKLDAVLDRAQVVPSALSGATLEVRDIADRPEWTATYAMSVPVLTRADADGSNEVHAAAAGVKSLASKCTRRLARSARQPNAARRPRRPHCRARRRG